MLPTQKSRSVKEDALLSAKVTVLMPAWNAATTIEKSIRSVMADDPRIDLIVVDDASTDSTSTVVLALEHEYPGRILLDRFSTNSGPSAARSHALSLARGNWIGLLDADDLWIKGRLSRLEPFFPDADIVSDSLEVRDGSKVYVIPSRFRPSNQMLDRQSLLEYDLGYLQPLIRREFLTTNQLDWRGNFRHSEDLLLAWRMLSKGARWLHVQEPGYVYIRSQSSLTSQRRQGLEKGIEVLRLLHEESLENAILTSAIARRIQVKKDLIAIEDIKDRLEPKRIAKVILPIFRLLCLYARGRYI